jgi:hypothetical protein
LCVLVVNGKDGADPAHHAANAALLDELRATLTGARRLTAPGEHRALIGATSESALDLLVVDRASEGARFPQKAGVGLARKIGMDLALALHVAGKVRSALLYCTDADVTLPERHFDRPELASRVEPGKLGAVVFPFWHEPSADAAVTHATALYELSLRYYVAGLAAAGSPYAFHTVGSAMAVHAQAYASVRGTPKREAGEDFYLLGKIAKVEPVFRAALPEIRIRSRASDRTPFGTGAFVTSGARGRERTFYAPETFSALARWLAALEALSVDGSVERFFDARAGLPADEWSAVERALFVTKGRESFVAAIRDAASEAARRARVHDWFDAFRTLKFVHALRASLWPDVGCRDALARAPFAPPGQASESLDESRRAFRDAEARTSPLFGPSRGTA